MNDEVTAVEPDDTDAVDAMARRAGADLRHHAPPNGLEHTIRRAQIRSATRNVAIGAVGIALVVVAIAAVSNGSNSSPVKPVETSPVTTVAATTASTTESTQPTAITMPDPTAIAGPFDGSLSDIIFTTQQDEVGGGRTLYTAKADGSAPQIVLAGAPSGGAGLSPDGTKWLSTRPGGSKNLNWPWIDDLVGNDSGYVPVSDPDLNLGEPSWSFDGTHLAAEGFSDVPGKKGIYTIAIDGTDLRRLTDPGAKVDVGAAFTRDGTKVLFSRTTEDGDNLDRVQLMIVNADGTGLREVGPPQYHVGPAKWSPDGTKVAFIAVDGQGSFFDEKRRAVFLADVSGGDAVQLTDWIDVIDVDWAPDGSQFTLVVFAPRSPGANVFDYRIHTMDVDGSNLRQVVSPATRSGFDDSPRFSPDGTKLMYGEGSGNPRKGSVWVLDLATGETTMILPPSKTGWQASWVELET